LKPHLPHSDDHRRRQTTVVLVILGVIAAAVFILAARFVSGSEELGRPQPPASLDANGFQQ
jgi:hypothetical protein